MIETARRRFDSHFVANKMSQLAAELTAVPTEAGITDDQRLAVLRAGAFSPTSFL
jgi:hypothetical protein